MATYYIQWEIDLAADSAEDAARKALEIMRDENALATVFDVTNCDTLKTSRIDLAEIDDEIDFVRSKN